MRKTIQVFWAPTRKFDLTQGHQRFVVGPYHFEYLLTVGVISVPG